MLDFEKKFYSEKVKFIAGCDEAGRGPLCGPVVAAAVILPKDYINEEINDSKKLTEKKREKIFLDIIKNAISIGVSFVDAKTIDKINIYEASRLAMLNALKNMKHNYDFVVTDCMPLPTETKPVEALVKGDAKCACIAAASIVAKVCRDRYMKEISKKYPEFEFDKNKGYGTKKHLEALEKYGPIEGFHRFSYDPIKCKQLKLL